MAESMWEEVFKWCLKNTNILDATDEKHGGSLLHFASMKGYAPIVTKLLAKGAKIDMKDNAGDTSLHVATSKDKSQVAQILIRNGANVNHQGSDKMRPIQHSVMDKNAK